MEDINIVLIMALIIGVIILFVLILFIMNSKNQNDKILNELLKSLDNNKSSNDNLVKDDINKLKDKVSMDLLYFQNHILDTFKSDFDKLNANTTNRLIDIETKVNDSLLTGFEKTNASFNNIMQQMAKIDETQNSLKDLSFNISSLQNVLTDKKSRGTYGEIELYTILENSFGVNNSIYQRQFKLSNGTIADCVLHAPIPLGKIVIDSKFPLENYNRMYDNELNSEQKNRATLDFKKDVVKHLKDIHLKYIIAGETSEIAYMFIPSEVIFAEIIGRFYDVVQMSYKFKVYIVSPTTLMAYITAIKAICLGQQRSEKVELIQCEFIKLSNEFERFATRWNIIEKDFEKLNKDISNFTITTDKIQRRFNQIDSFELDKIEN